jgi:rod shape-determining protein MreD
MNQPNYILLPVSPAFIFLSLLAAFLLNFLPWGGMPGVPDFVALTLVFWNIHQPRKVGVGVAFLMGLLMDVHNASLLGENALAYTLLTYFAITIHRRVLWFALIKQMLHVFPLFLVAQIIQATVQFIVNGKYPSVLFFSQSVATAILWPVATWILLAPQRRAVNRDETRPI